MSEPITITIDLDLDRHLAEHRGFDHEGEPVSGPTTVEDVVLGLVVDRLVNRFVSGRGAWDNTVRDRVNEVTHEVIVEKITPMVTDAIAAGVQKTNSYGEPIGEPVTMRDVIVATAKEWLEKPTNDYGRDRKTRLQALLHDEVERAMKAELKATIDAAKAEVEAAVREKGAEVLAETITRLAAGR